MKKKNNYFAIYLANLLLFSDNYDIILADAIVGINF